MKLILSLFLVLPFLSVSAQNASESAAKTTEGDLQRALVELTALRNDIGAKKIPLAKTINDLEAQKIDLTDRRDKVVELATGGDRIKAELQERLETLSDQNDYLSTAIDNYLAELVGSNLHISEIQVYDEVISSARGHSKDHSLKDKYGLQVAALNASFDRIFKMVGGYTFAGESELDGGELVSGNFAVVGPIEVFSDGQNVGIVDLAPEQLRPLLVTIPGAPEEQMKALTTGGSGTLFFDSKLGQALDILLLKEPILDHIAKGGLVMYPILALATAAFLVSIFKAFEIASVKKAKPQDLATILDHINNGRNDDALAYANGVKGPVGEMMTAALEHLDFDDEVIEEILYEKMLGAQPKLERMLPFIAVTAATAPLLGLLGTVTGMINTFKLITIFGTGDAAQLSSGISEALITTQFGLIIAIPTLIVHSILSRMTKSVLGSMERTALGFVNGLPHKN